VRKQGRESARSSEQEAQQVSCPKSIRSSTPEIRCSVLFQRKLGQRWGVRGGMLKIAPGQYLFTPFFEEIGTFFNKLKNITAANGWKQFSKIKSLPPDYGTHCAQ